MKVKIPEDLRQYDLWHHIERQARLFRTFLIIEAVIIFFLIFVVFIQSAQDIPVIRVNGDGTPELISSRKKGNEPTPEEAEYVAREVSTNLLELLPGAIARDMARGLAMMSRESAERWQKNIEADKNLPKIDESNLRTKLTWPTTPPARITTDKQDGVQRYYVESIARLSYYAGNLFTKPVKVDLVRIRVQLRVIPRSSIRLSGLLVESFDRTYEPTTVPEEASPGEIGQGPAPLQAPGVQTGNAPPAPGRSPQ